MSADGEIEVKVSSDGADQAAEDLSDASETSVGGGGGRGGKQQGLLGKSLRGGALLAAIIAIVELLGPLGDFLSATLEVLKAFLAPIALIIVRLLSPFLRLAVTRLLPMWLSFMQDIMPVVDRIAELIWNGLSTTVSLLSMLPQLPGKIWNLMQRGFEWVETQVGVATQFLRTLPRRIWEFLQQLPRMIGSVISRRIPDVPTSPSGVVDTAVDTATGLGGGGGGGGGDGGLGQTIISFTGGLGAFVEQVQRDNNITLP